MKHDRAARARDPVVQHAAVGPVGDPLSDSKQHLRGNRATPSLIIACGAFVDLASDRRILGLTN